MQILSPSLKNEREMTQNILEANLTGDLVEMPSGPLQYALGLSYRDNSFNFVPDNLSDNANFLDPIAGTYPNEPSFGEFDVSELYGELLIPIVDDGPAGVDHFTRRARRPHLGLEHVEHAQSRNVQGADRLGLYSTLPDARRVQPSVPCAEFGRALSSRARKSSAVSARVTIVRRISLRISVTAPRPPILRRQTHSYNICRQLMGPTGAFEYYDNRALALQPTVGNTGVSNSFGNPNFREEQADTFTLGMVMDVTDNVTLTVDWYEIEIMDMIALGKCRLDLSALPGSRVQSRRRSECGAVRARQQGSGQRRARERRSNVHEPGTRGDVRRRRAGRLEQGLVGRSVRPELRREYRPQIDHAGTAVGGGGGARRLQQLLAADSVSAVRLPDVLDVQLLPRAVERLAEAPVLAGAHGRVLHDQPYMRTPVATARIRTSTCSRRLSATRFADKYNLTVGIENLLDEDPPCVGAEPNRATVRVHLRACVASAGRSVQRHLRRARAALLRRHDDGLLI